MNHRFIKKDIVREGNKNGTIIFSLDFFKSGINQKLNFPDIKNLK